MPIFMMGLSLEKNKIFSLRAKLVGLFLRENYDYECVLS